MQKNILVSLTATATAFSMIVAPSITAFAQDTPVEIGPSSEPVAVESITVDQGQTAINVSGNVVTVENDVTSSGTNGEYEEVEYTDETKTYYKSDDAVKAYSGANVTIGGNLNADGDDQTGIFSWGSTITVGENVSANGRGVEANNSTVTVEGNVNSADDAVTAHDESTVIVNGDVISTGIHNKTSSGEYNPETKKYASEKESFYGNGIQTDGSADIFVGGNVIGTNDSAVDILQGKYDQDQNYPAGQIVIEGTIATDNDKYSRINIGNIYYHEGSEEITATYETKQDVLDSIPEITIYEMDKDIVSLGRVPKNATHEQYQEIYNDVVNAINFIIKKSDDVKYTDDMTNINPVTAANDKVFNTVNINKAFKMAADVPEGYELSGGDNNNVTVTPNGDGTYTLVLTDLRGGINVTIKAIVRPSEDGNTAEVVVTPTSTPSYADPNQAPAGAIVVSTASSSAEQVAASAAISGDKPAQMVSFNMSQITPIQYKEAIISNVASAPAGGALNIQTDRIACFDAKMIAAIKARPDLDVNVVFTYGGKRLKVTIPAGYDVDSLLDDYGYCGFLRLMSILGSTEI